MLEYRGAPVVYRGGCPLGMQLFVCVLFPYPRIRISTKTTYRLMGLMHRPNRLPHGGGGHSAWCAWLAEELDNPVHHACEFSARLMGGKMLEIQSFLLTRQNNFDVRSILTWTRHDKIGRCPLCEKNDDLHSIDGMHALKRRRESS